MVLENVKEMWTETPRLASGKKGRSVNKDRFISKMFASQADPIYCLGGELTAMHLGFYEVTRSFSYFSVELRVDSLCSLTLARIYHALLEE